jgi:hypothetical protein
VALTKYKTINFRKATVDTIEQANDILENYAAQGLVLTLRQLYYQFVARGLLPENTQRQYDRLQSICNDARLAGVMDWDHLIDRTRNLVERNSWDSPAAMVKWSAERFHKDLWKPQKRRLEVWVEKDAAIGVIEGICHGADVPYFSSRGYTSVSEMYSAAQRIRWYIEAGEQVLILHIGDHDPSGVDMTRDIEERLRLMISQDWAGLNMGVGQHTRGSIRQSMTEHMAAQGNQRIGLSGMPPWSVKRIALTLDQVEQYNPPPNFAKQSDARYRTYVEKTGLTDSWELDALEPSVLQDLIVNEIEDWRDEDLWDDTVEEMEHDRAMLKRISENWTDITANLPGHWSES